MRHETADEELYEKLHPGDKLENREAHLLELKRLGYEVGAGSMVGLPGQDRLCSGKRHPVQYELDADMIGIGPFIPHPDTPLRDAPQGTLEKH